ncbi:MAG TPA: helix-turn-helix domain-containing protein [Candidatus Wallbacteria bacterium]|nr:helix-turn-helix domain-containing protein [Candidatus Wallbacteria bacterium]
MKHPTDEIIISYLYKEASPGEIKEVEKHIAACRECAEKIEGIKKTIFDIDRMDDAAVPEFLESKLADFFDKIANIDNRAINSAEGTFDELNKKAEKLDNGEKFNYESGAGSKPGYNDGGGGGKAAGDIMTPEELAEYLKIPADSIYGMLGEIPHLILAGRVRFRRISVDKWLDSREKNSPAKMHAVKNFDDSVKLWRNII